MAVAESAPQADTWSVCIIRTTVGLYFNTALCRFLGNSGAFYSVCRQLMVQCTKVTPNDWLITMRSWFLWL